jgi:hypothetical protein
MRTALLGTLVLASVAVQQPAPTPRQWTTIRDGDAGFVAEFPAPPERRTQPNGMIRWMVTLDNDSYAYIASAIAIPPERVALGEAKVLDDATAGGLRGLPGAQKLSETAIRVGGHAGREIIMLAPGTGGLLRLTSRAVLAGDRLYFVTAVSPAEGYDQKEVDRFLLSLGFMPR